MRVRRASPVGEKASLRKDSGPSDGPPTEPPFKRVLVANRGEIAMRIIRACHELGVDAVAVYSDADADAAHVRVADAAIRLGPAPAAESYLRGDAIIDAARNSGAEAIHPGYGFLAERASFAKAVEEAGLVFVGPTSASIAAVGDKLAARRLARAAGVPVVAGTLEPAAVERVDALDATLADADSVGFPMFVKAAAGGGGRGMRRVTTREELPAALASGSAEALAAFGDGAVYLEREIRPARHVEVQLLGDATGTIVALGERDCSIQRRHQKLVEESPAPGLTAGERRELHDFAVRVARAAELRNAATAEFLLDGDRRFWFLEVNTRIQVEHGVTELVTGLDLVAWQIRIAAGERLPDEVLVVQPRGHAIEARVYAEDPHRRFPPVAGSVTAWRMPAGPGVRVDTAIEAGDRIPPDYDSLIAKVLVVDVDREAAIGRLGRVLDEVEIGGIQTTLPFHRFVASHPGFKAAELSTDWVADQWQPRVQKDRGAALEIAARVAVAVAPTSPSSSGPSGVGAETRVEPGSGSSAGVDQPGRGSGWSRVAREEGVDRWRER